jgi:hypothetical protein
VALDQDLRRIADAAARYCEPGEELVGIIPAEPEDGVRAYLCAFGADDDSRSWVVLDERGRLVRSRELVRDVVSIAALCELAEETAAGGDLERLRADLVTLRLTESPPGIEEAEAAALELERVLGAPPRLATPSYLDAVGAATRRLEQTLGDGGASPFATALTQSRVAVEELAAEVEGRYKLELT